jgi:hypothetical protein
MNSSRTAVRLCSVAEVCLNWLWSACTRGNRNGGSEGIGLIVEGGWNWRAVDQSKLLGLNATRGDGVFARCQMVTTAMMTAMATTKRDRRRGMLLFEYKVWVGDGDIGVLDKTMGGQRRRREGS